MKNTKQNKWLIFPLEVVERELDGKLLVCNEALARGWNCIIGTDLQIRKSIAALPPGVMFLKSALAHELSYLRSLKARGHKIVCLDEEGLVQNNLEYLVSVRSTPETVHEVDAFLFWGKVQCEAYKKAYPQYKDKLHTTSNPRVDIWENKKYQALCQQTVLDIQKQYGDYFIIPTSFGSYNHFMGKDGAMAVYKAGCFVTEDSVAFFEAYEEYAKNIYYGFINLIEPLSKKFPNINIIVRPHPSENRKPWDELAELYDNVHVVFSGSVTPWLLGAKAVLHCGSTTAVEAHLLGRTAVSYCRGYSDPRYMLEVPAKVSINVTKAEEVLEILEKIVNGVDVESQHPEIAAGHEWLKDWADSIDSYESAGKIMDVIDALNVGAVPYALKKIPAVVELDVQALKRFVWFCLRILDYIPFIQHILPFKIKYGLGVHRYNKNKTNDMDSAKVEKFLEKLNTIDHKRGAEIHVLRKNIMALIPKP